MGKRINRTRIMIIKEFLEGARRGSKKTRLMYRANLNLQAFEIYLEALEKSGYVEEDSGTFRTTPEGRDAIDDLNKACAILEKFNKHYKGY
jgi:predicted transcriptional regulator